nr:retrovirus-related Pol polyprotein from transposon TNT 1-94 [Tanacetum cinerariifolium]
MTGNLKLLINFVWKFMGTVHFENDHVAAILGFGDLQWGNILITRVYFIEGLGHNLFSVGQLCDLDLEVAFQRNACFVRNLEGVDLLKGYRSTNLYTINLHEMASTSSICLMAHASSTKSWLWHQRLSHLNLDTINDLARNDLVTSILKFKYHKEHLCPSCEQRKSKRASHPPKPIPNSRQRLHLLHMDLCGPMRITSINGKQYILVIVDDYSRYTWVHFLRSKDEAPAVIITFLKRITVLLQSHVIIIRTDNSTEFKNHVFKVYFDSIGISHQISSLFLWAEAIATAKPDISFLHVFGALCYPKNDCEDIGKLGAKGDIGFFTGYSADFCAYRIYNRRTKKIIETMNVSVDELSAMAFEQRSSKPGLQCMTSGQISSGLDLTYAPSTITKQQPTEGELDLLFEAMYDDYFGGQPSATVENVPPVQEPQVHQTSTASITIADNISIQTNSSSQATNIPITSQDVDELNLNAMVDGNMFVNPFATSSSNAAKTSSSQNVDPSNMHTSYASITHAKSRNKLSQQSKLDNIKSIRLNDDDLILVDDSSTVVLIKVWLQFSLMNSCEAFKSNESLNKRWTFIKVPSPSFVVDERVIWIEVSGLPLCAWGSSAFKKIANLFGNFNFFDDDVEDSMCMGRACITTKIQSLISEKSDDDHDMEEHRSTNEDVDPNAALDDFIQQNIVKESALKDSKEGDQANVSTHVAGDNETLFFGKVNEEYFVTKEDKPSKEDVSDTSKPPGFENFIKENSECSISSNASRSCKCSTSFGNYKRKELKGLSFIDEMSRMIEVGGTFGYDVKGCKKSLWKMINGIGMIRDECVKGIMLTKIELTVEQSQQGVSNDVLLESDSSPHAHTQTTKTYYKHQDSRIMKAQESKTKTSVNSDIQDLPLRYQVYQGRWLASFQVDAKYEHGGQDTRSHGGKDDQD